jgi:excisionase family DNA binding protein
MPNKKGAAAKHTPKSVVLDDTRLAYSMRESGQLLGLCEKSIYNLIQAGKLHAVKPANRVLVPRESIEKMLRGEA